MGITLDSGQGIQIISSPVADTVRMIMNINFRIFLLAVFCLAVVAVGVAAQEAVSLSPDVGVRVTLSANREKSLSFDAAIDQYCEISSNATDEQPLTMSVLDPAGEVLVKYGDDTGDIVFIAPSSGKYRLVLKIDVPDAAMAKTYGEKQFNINYTNKLQLPKDAQTRSTRVVNGYQAKIVNEPGDEGKTYFLVQKGGKTKAIMREQKQLEGGFYFSDDPDALEGGASQQSVALMRGTPDKTGDGIPDVAVEYFSGGAHCCFEITFFELGDRVRQLPTIGTDNDHMSAIDKKPGGGLRFVYAEQAFAYWNINFAQSPMPAVTWEFDKSDKLVPRFDLMRKPAPALAVLKRKATAARAKIPPSPYVSPDDNFNDWDDAFWGDMLDLIFTGHEDVAWQYFDMVWPAKKKGKEKFLADFKEQLAQTSYGEWKKQGH
ncbi:MAG TPA: hypothetical protein VGJ02_02830 [Pyrinomonadaceae bacterium]